MAAKPQAKNSAVVNVRSKKTIALPPAMLGFSSLVTPDTYDPSKPKLKGNFHYKAEAFPLLQATIQKECIDAFLAKLTEDSGFPLKTAMTAEEWLAEKLKEPKDEARIKLPHIVLMCNASFRGRDGELQEVALSAWDRHNNKLDLKKLRISADSIVEPIVKPGLFASKQLMSIPQPTLRLVGIRVLKLVQFGGSSAPAETDEEAIKEALGQDFDMDQDLSAFAAGSKAPASADGADAVEEMF